MPNTKISLLVTTALAFAGPGLLTASAQAADAPEASATGNGQLSDIVVTATRRSESLQRVPVSVTVISAEQIEKLGAVTLKDLQFTIPNLSFGGQSSARRPDITLRGINSATRVPGFEGSIGFFVDGIYQPFPLQWTNPVADVERIEVLYGPQDTLFGKNTIAGAISITTKKPGTELGGYATAEYGSYNSVVLRGAVDIPLVKDTLFARISAYGAWRDGYITNVYDGDKYNNVNQQGGRLQLRYAPAGPVEVNMSLGGLTERMKQVQGQTIGDAYSTGDPRKVNVNSTPRTTRDLLDFRLEASYGFDSGAKITSLTGASAGKALYRTDEDGNPVDKWLTNIYDKTRSFSQEFRLTSATGGAFDYVAGVYYLNTYWAQPGSLQILPGDPNSTVGGLALINPDGSINYDGGKAKRVSGTTYAAYANVRYHFTDQWTLNVGARTAYDIKDLTYPGQITYGDGFLNLCKLGASFGAGCLIPGGAYPFIAPYQDSLSNFAVTGSASVDFQATRDLLFYAKISNGQKGGGWNTDLATSGPPTKFSPEKVINYELGLKSEFFDRHVRFNADVFYQDYKNKQETVFINITQGFRISNAAKATIKGGEATATLAFGDFLINGGFGYLDPTYSDFQCTQTVNCRGQQLVFATKVTSNGSIDYSHQFGNTGKLSLQAAVTYRDKMYFTLPNTDSNSVAGYALVSARASFDIGNTQIYVAGKNIFNKTYLISNFPGSPSYPGYGATSTVLYGEPRMLTIGVTQKF